MNAKITTTAVLITIAAIIAAIAASDWRFDFAALEAWAQDHTVLGSVVFVGIFIASTLMPITSLPLLPLSARAYGVPMTCILSIAGWWLGCLIAFELTRWGRPHLERLVSKKMLERPKGMLSRKPTFGTIVFLRMLFPGDFVGIALGLMPAVTFRNFALATLIGTIPGGIVASYAGGEFGRGRYWTAIVLIAAMFIAMALVRRLWESRAKPDDAMAVTEETPSRSVSARS